MSTDPKPILIYSVHAASSEHEAKSFAHVKIFPPDKDIERDVDFCLVEVPFLFEKPKKIAGTNAAQALELAKTFALTAAKDNGFQLTDVTEI